MEPMKPLVIASLVLSTIMVSENSAQVKPGTQVVTPAKVDTNALIVIRGRDSTVTDTAAIPVELRIVGDTAYVTVWKNEFSSYLYFLTRQPDGSWQKTNRFSILLYNRKP